MAFQSAASSLVDEGKHPVEQLEILEKKVIEHHGDIDAVIECRIKQLALHRLLFYLYEFPLQGLMRAEIALTTAYADGGYFKQAEEHLARAREVAGGCLHDDAQCQRLQADIFIAEGAIQLAKGSTKQPFSQSGASDSQRDRRTEEHLEAAKRSLGEAERLTREAYGEDDIRFTRIYTMQAQRCQQMKKYEDAIDYFLDSWEVWESLKGRRSEEVIRALLQVAAVEHLAGKVDKACDTQGKVVDDLRDMWAESEGDAAGPLSDMLVDASIQLAQWLQAQKEESKSKQALSLLEEVHDIVTDELGDEKDAFPYTWEQHSEKPLAIELEDRRNGRNIAKDEWERRSYLVDQYGTKVPVVDEHGNILDLHMLAEKYFPVTVYLEESSEKQKKRAKAVEIKRDIALLQLKLGNNDTALQYLNDVHYFERCLHGSQSTKVARTLKALGTVHMVKCNWGEAEQCLYQAARIFENEHPPNNAIIKDIHNQLRSIAGK